MKKRYLIMGLLGMLLVPTIAKADMSGPELDYKVRVINPDGVKCEGYKKETIIPVNTIGHAYNDYDGKIDVDFGDVYCIVDEDDVLPVELDLNDYKTKYTSSYYIFGKDVYLYKGPSFVYDKVDNGYEVPVGTFVESNYSSGPFDYVEINGHKGWMLNDTYDSNEYAGRVNIAVKVKASDNWKEYLLKDYELLDKPFGEKNGATIKKDSKLENYYEADLEDGICYYFKDKNGWLCKNNNNEFLIKSERTYYQGKLIVINNAKMYSDPNKLSDDDVIANIDKSGVVPVKYYSYGYFTDSYMDAVYVTYNGKSGWVVEFKEKDSFIYYPDEYGMDEFELTKPIETYTDIDSSSVVYKANKGDTIYVVKDYENYKTNEKWLLLLNDKDEIGFVTKKDFEIAVGDEVTIPETTPKETSLYEHQINEEAEMDAKTKENNRKEKKKKENKAIFYTIGGAVAVAVIGLTTIIIVNRRKNSKTIEETLKEESKNKDVKIEETKVEEVKPVETQKETKKTKKHDK